MLWKKESQAHDALYVDLFAHGTGVCEFALNLFTTKSDQPEKSDAIAMQKRTEGNEKFRAQKWLDAMELYGDSLRFAKLESEHLSLAYSNRAMCFLKLQMYENCLKDLELATEAGYPDNLKAKLEDRRKICLEKMQNERHAESTLNFQPNDQFPFLSNATTVRRNKNGEHSIVAETDIDVGQVVSMEEPLHAHLLGNIGSTCSICFKEYGNLVPCKNCAQAMFCGKCRGNKLHDYECGIKNMISEIRPIFLFVLRGILKILEAFPSVDDLMAFVEQNRKRPKEFPTHVLDKQTKYQTFFNSTELLPFRDEESIMHTFVIYKSMLQIPQINKMFQQTKHRRFLMHLIDHHGRSMSQEMSPFRISSLMNRYFKHSCNANLLEMFCDGTLIRFAVKPIKQGEEVTITQISEGRHKLLSDLRGEKCDCPRCNGREASPVERQRMAADPTYVNSHSQMYLMHINDDEFNPKALMDNCLAILRKYGRMDWNDEFHRIHVIFGRLYRTYSMNGFNFNHRLARARFAKLFE